MSVVREYDSGGGSVAELKAALALRERELAEAHEREAASAEILRVIANSPADTQPVFDAIVRSGAKLFPGAAVTIGMSEGDKVVGTAIAEPDRARAESWRSRFPVPLTRSYLHGVCILDAKVVDIPDVEAAPAELVLGAKNFLASGYRAITMVPLVEGKAAIGALSVVRPAAGAITKEQLALLKAFASQAVIAIENARLLGELRESLSQQTATADVLKVISRSTFDLQTVLDTLVESSAKLCDALDSVMFLRRDDHLVVSAHYGPIPMDFGKYPIGRGWVTGRSLVDRVPVHVHDLQSANAEFPDGSEMAQRLGHHTILAVPLLRENEAIGAIGIRRNEIRPFTNKQIELVQTFADQAVIAIENVRLFEAEQQRTAELAESLEQQTATSEVLKVISSSPGDLEPVFRVMLENATQLCGARFGALNICDGEKFKTVALHNPPPGFAARQGESWRPRPKSGLARIAATRQVVHIDDLRTQQPYLEGDPAVVALSEVAGARTLLLVPMLKDDKLVGNISIYRQEIRPFSDKQIELVQNFAAQAVIAIENTRLLSELRESLEQQTATSQVLSVISSSPGELEPVFNAMLENATRICEAKLGVLFLNEGHNFRAVAVHGDSDYAEGYRREPVVDMTARVQNNTPLDRVLREKRTIHIHDLRNDEAYVADNPRMKALVESAGARTHLVVPMLKDDELVGVIVIYRQEVRPFGDKQIELVQNFAAQAVIAIENTRLLKELRESLEQQTATSEVLKVIASSTGELAPVFSTMLENAARLCEASYGAMWLRDGDGWRAAAMHGDLPAVYLDRWRSGTVFKIGPGVPMARVLATRQPVHVPDMRDDAGYLAGDLLPVSAVEEAGIRTQFSVPMMRDEDVVGVITIYRREVRPFGDKQIELIQNFAAQAVIAIENTRLLSELRESLSQQTATAEVLKVISSSPGELEPVFQAMLENATRICEAKIGILWGFEDGSYTAISMLGISPAYAEYLNSGPFRPGPATGLGRVAIERQTVHIVDTRAEQAYADRDPFRIATAELGGARTLLNVPMLKEGKLIGALGIYRQEVRPFTDKQIELVTNFAAQAVIAIENTRLLNELRESLQQQTATADVLKVISTSPGELQPVFDTMLAKATELCEAAYGTMWLRDGDVIRVVSYHGELPEAFREIWQTGSVISADADTPVARSMRSGEPVYVQDLREDRGYREGHPLAVAAADIGGIRTLVAVPMLKEGGNIGGITIYRREVRAFSDKQIDLVKNFAAQAVIAIENTRLLKELRQRTDDLSESLEQQTATSEVLRVISSSPGDLEPVFESILKNATDICEAKFATLFRFDGEAFFPASHIGAPPELVEAHSKRGAFKAVEGTTLYKVWQTKDAVQTEDDAKAPKPGHHVVFGGARSTVGVPMLKDDRLIGIIVIYRQEVRPFTEKQIELVQNFAAQAVIAIENTRLLNELRESLEQQTATSEVLKVISSSPGELDPVFSTILENATSICGAHFGNLFLHDDDGFRAVAMFNAPPDYAEIRKGQAFNPAPDTGLGRMVVTRRVFHVADLRDTEGYRRRNAFSVGGVERGGIRTLLAVPMLKDGNLAGAIVIYRQEVKPFTDKQIELVQSFAAQAVIAIENARLLNELRRRTDDLTESLQQQTATSDILEVISNSPTDSQPAFDAIVRSGLKLFPDSIVVISLPEADQVKLAAIAGADADLEALRARYPMPLSREFITGTALLDGREMDFADARETPDQLMPGRQNFLASGYRAITVMPMVRGDKAIGAISVVARQPRQLTNKQRELLRTFAAQAVIAIENTRLFNELRQRTDDLTELLEYQTATSEILTVISRSPTDTQPVFDIIGERAEKLCDADVSVVSRVDGELIQLASIHGVSAEGVEALRSLYPLGLERETITTRTVRSAAVVHVADVLADPTYDTKVAARAAGYRAGLGVPMIRDGQVIGTIFVGRKVPRSYTDSQIQLLKTFADQAVIAIGNVRLFREVQERTEDLQESLQQQTATADVLKVISRSTFDLPAVLTTLVESAARLCKADKAQILRPSQKENGFYAAASFGYTREYDEYLRGLTFAPGREGVVGRVLLERKPVQIADVLADLDYRLAETQRLGGFRTHLGLPLLREGNPIGILVVSRVTVQPFDDKEIDLLTTFADQAVIAIENVRLFDEVQARTDDLSESLQQQTATADVLKIISRSAFDLKTVLDTLLRSAARLCEADQGTITQRAGDKFFRSVAFGYPQAFMDYVKDIPVDVNRDTGTGRALLESKVVHIPDVQADPEYKWADAQRLGGYSAMLGVPMLRDGEPIGVLTLTRKEPRVFTDKQIELVATFADQAAIAIENVRLFEEIQEKSHQLEEASKHKSQFLANMSHELRTPLNAILGYTELIADGVYGDTPEKVQTTLRRIITNGKHLLGLINDVLDLSKIEAGQLTLSLGDYSMKDVVHNVYGAVEPLAAEKKLAFKVEIAPDLPVGHGDERRLTQVLLNLVGNSIKFTDDGSVTIQASLKDGMYNVAVRDTGPGISEEDQKKLFQEFQQADSSTTKKKGGTGLGLAISKRIIEMHGGRIWLESKLGAGSIFTFTVPVRAEQAKRAI